MEILKVSAQSDASATAGALANTIRESGAAELQGIGPKAINQAVKAIAIARSYLASSGVDLVAMPTFVDVEIDGEQRTALRFSITPRHRLHQPHEDGFAEDTEEPREAQAEPEPASSVESAEDVPETRDEAETVPSRPSSLSEAITGRPASELAASGEREGEGEADEPSRAAADEDDDSDRSEEEAGESRRRSSFFDRFRQSEADADRDVF